jgi:hypothetical protein
MGIISHSSPLWSRIAGALVVTGASAAIAAVNISDYTRGSAAGWVFLPVILIVLASMTLAYRLVRVSFRADAAGLVIHNIFRTRQVPLTEVVGFDIGARRAFGHQIWVITRSGAFPIEAYGSRPLRALLFDTAGELDGWLAEAREHGAQLS